MLPTRVAFCDVSRVSAVEPAVVVTTDPPDDATFTLDVPLTIVEGAVHVASPRQNVVADALVPLFKLVTGRFPVTPVARGKLVALVKDIDAGVPNAVTLPEGSSWGDLAAAIVINTSFVPAENVTAAFELDELYTVVRVSVLADE